MRQLGKILLQGLLVILPIGLTMFIVYWVFYSAEALFSPILKSFLPPSWYFPGLGLFVGVVGIFSIGLLVNAYAVKTIFQYAENIMERIPLVKTLFIALRDLTRLFSSDEKKRELKSVVAVQLSEDLRLIGFITATVDESLFVGEKDLVAVYLPLSYQIGGYTVYVKRDQLKPMDISVEHAMRMTLTAGVGTGKEHV